MIVESTAASDDLIWTFFFFFNLWECENRVLLLMMNAEEEMDVW